MRGDARFLLSLTSIALCATAALALPPKAEAVIRLSSPNMVSLTNGLVGYWTFDGPVTNWNTNTTRDLSGNGSIGHLMNMSTSSSPVPGKIGQAMNFNGSTNFIDNGDVLRLTSGSFTLSAWTYATSTSHQLFIIHGEGCIAWSSYFLSIAGQEGGGSNPGKYSFGFATANSPADMQVHSNSSATTSKWVLVTGVYDGRAPTTTTSMSYKARTRTDISLSMRSSA